MIRLIGCRQMPKARIAFAVDDVEKKIFEPLGMMRSMYCNSSEKVPRRACGYGMKSGTARRVPDIVQR